MSLRDRLRDLRDDSVLGGVPPGLRALERRADDTAVLAARSYFDQRECALDDADARVFSQWGEDGILDWLIRNLPGVPKTFVEIGVEDYTECNTRFLAAIGWSGVAFEGDPAAVRAGQRHPEVWSGRAELVSAWVEPPTVDELVTSRVTGDVGVFSLDVDGIDYYLLEALVCITPWIVVCEYNARYGPDAVVSVPYSPGFDRRTAHHSWLHHGLSLGAVEAWGSSRDLTLVAVNREGTNAFLVRDDVRPESIPPRTARELWRPLTFSEHRDTGGKHAPISFDAERRIVDALPVVDVGERLARE